MFLHNFEMVIVGVLTYEYYSKFAGMWFHDPLSSNRHVFTKKDGSAIYWSDDVLHWWAGSKSSADPTHSSFGSGSCYFKVSSGAELRYERFTADGIEFIWHQNQPAG